MYVVFTHLQASLTADKVAAAILGPAQRSLHALRLRVHGVDGAGGQHLGLVKDLPTGVFGSRRVRAEGVYGGGRGSLQFGGKG